MTEFELLARLIPSLPTNEMVVKGAGDDCAVLDLGIPDRLVVFKTDALVEDVHFTATTPPPKVGRKALARTLSDLAAAAAKPISCLVTAGLPKGFDPEFVFGFYEGLNDLAREYSMSVAGGETSRSAGGIFFSIAAIGSIPRGRVISRAGAKPGDAIFVTGELGGSISGKHLDFEPRIAQAEWLAERFAIHAMMDLSDGLAGDLRHILQASAVGSELLSCAIPISRAARLKAKGESSAKPPLLAALTDGEDYELLFTLPSRQAVSLVDQWKAQFSQLKISCIGKITAQSGLRLRDKDGMGSSAHMVIHTSKSPDETIAHGERVGRSAQPGMVFGLVGDLGAGKTQFVRGFARGLGVTERVHSPTFTLVNEYRTGRLPCFHLDLYRLDDAAQVLSAGLGPYFVPTDGVTLVEWFDKAGDDVALSPNLRIITFGVKSDSERIIGYEDPWT